VPKAELGRRRLLENCRAWHWEREDEYASDGDHQGAMRHREIAARLDREIATLAPVSSIRNAART
jgi:hypothetical protein